MFVHLIPWDDRLVSIAAVATITTFCRRIVGSKN